MNIHDPYLRHPEKFSNKRYVSMEYSYDEIYVDSLVTQEAGNEQYYAVYRGRFESMSSRKETFLNSRFLIKYINTFYMNGGIDIVLDRINNKNDVVCPAEIVGSFMSIIEATTPYLLNSVVKRKGEDIIRTVIKYVLNSPSEIVKTFSSEVIKYMYNGVVTISKRLYSLSKSAEIFEKFYLQIALVCVKTDFLERKLNGVSFLGEINKSIKNKEFTVVTKADLVEIVEKGTYSLFQRISSSRL